MIKRNVLAPLRHENSPSLKNLDARFIEAVYDRGNVHSAAYQWGTLGIPPGRIEGKSLPDSWSMFFDSEDHYGSFMRIDPVRLDFLEDLGSRLRLYDEVWTRVKAK
jgi:spermidine/putrescine-binding protein